MSGARRTLHQFPISHYCEKTRWHLDAKGLSYRVRNLLPGAHAVINARLAGASSVPVLVEDGRAIGDSTDIAMHLEARYTNAPLLPKDAGFRAAVLEHEAYFDERMGPAVRRWLYGQAMATPGMVAELFFRGYGTLARASGWFIGGQLERTIRKHYRIDEAGIAEASTQIDEAVERLERLIEGHPGRHVVGNGLTLADVTAAALLAPLVGPAGSPWADLPPLGVVDARRDALRKRPAGQWVIARYAGDRPAPVR